MTTATDVMINPEDTAEGTHELVLSDAERRSLEAFGQAHRSQAGLSDDEAAAVLDDLFDTHAGAPSSGPSRAPAPAVSPSTRGRGDRPARPAQPPRPAAAGRTKSTGVASIREAARTSKQPPASEMPAIADFDPRLEQYVREARQWMFSDSAEDLRDDEVRIGFDGSPFRTGRASARGQGPHRPGLFEFARYRFAALAAQLGSRHRAG